MRRAAQVGNASVFGSGINPGWIEYVAAVASSPCRLVERVHHQSTAVADGADANMDDFGLAGLRVHPGHARDTEDAVFEFATPPIAMGNRVTAMPAINAIPAVVAAPAGIVTYADLPPVAAPLMASR